MSLVKLDDELSKSFLNDSKEEFDWNSDERGNSLKEIRYPLYSEKISNSRSFVHGCVVKNQDTTLAPFWVPCIETRDEHTHKVHECGLCVGTL